MNIKKEVLKGFLTGILSSLIGIITCTAILSIIEGVPIMKTFLLVKAENNLWMLLALGSLLNLATFFIFLNKNLEYKARGVVLATILVAFVAYTYYFIG